MYVRCRRDEKVEGRVGSVNSHLQFYKLLGSLEGIVVWQHCTDVKL